MPDKLSLFMEKFLFELMNISASFNIKVATLNRFAKKKCVIAKEQQISKVGSILLINKILNDNIDNLKAIKSKVYSFTYAENIFKTIIQLKASKIGWQEMQMFESIDEQLKNKVVTSIDNLNITMCEVSKALQAVNGNGDKENLKQIMSDTTATVSNLKKFSEKLNKRFLLFRLMF